jgi:hypothetical protein
MSAALRVRLILLAGLSVWASQGCASAHYVERGPDRGVVAIPEDSPELRAKAEKLMHDQFPEGYVIDAVRNVPIGRPYRTITQVGPVAEIETHQRHEIMFFYHAGQAGPPVLHSLPVASAPPPVQPASLTVQPSPADGLPAQPVPVSR